MKLQPLKQLRRFPLLSRYTREGGRRQLGGRPLRGVH